MTTLLRAQQLKKIYHRLHGDVVVLNGCDFTLAQGESVAVIGAGPGGYVASPVTP